MNEQPPGRRLGRGLAVLIGDVNSPTPEPANQLAPDRTVPIELVSPNPRNPRRGFDEADLIELAQSIREHGVVQPVAVRPSPDQSGRYEIVAGERRWRATQRAGLAELPVSVRDVENRTALELAIIENVQQAKPPRPVSIQIEVG